ncbi:MAG: DedA family protein, partial [Sphingomonadaceae bacterium]|nr:DedA family protein [Sphingomonadaceae bacterium]
RRLYDRLLVLAGRRDAEWWLALVAFIDGALFTIPPELLQLPMSIARPARSLRYGVVGLVASAAGAVVAYYIGAALFEGVALPLLRFLGREDEFRRFATEVAKNALLWPLAFLLAPMPAAVAAGSVHLGLAGALAASVVGRGGRFLVVAALLKRYGAVAEHYIEAHFHRVALIAAALVAAYIGYRYVLAGR